MGNWKGREGMEWEGEGERSWERERCVEQVLISHFK